MNIHTRRLIDPTAWVIAQATSCWLWVVRVAMIASRDTPGGKHRYPRWLAISIIREREGWPEKLKRVHKRVSEEGSECLIGATCEEEDLAVVQNRLFLARQLPAFLFPEFLRRMFAPLETLARWWTLEVYTYYVVDTNPTTGEETLHYYGLFVEIAPSPREFEERLELGLELVWRWMGLDDEFTGYMLSGVIPAELKARHEAVAQRARLTGWLVGLPTLYLCTLLGRRVWRHAENCSKPSHCRHWHRG